MKQFSIIDELDLGGGIDAQSPETNIPDTFASDILNMDPQARGSIKKRKGVEVLGGSLPLRASTVSSPEPGKICFTMDSSIDVSQVRNRPVLVKGISYNGATYDRDTNAETWWPSTNTTIERTLIASTPLVIDAADHGYTITNLIIQVKEVGATTNSHVYVDSVVIDSATLDITINHNLTEDTPVYVVISPSPSEAGVSHISTYSADTTTINIPATTHQLNHAQIVPAIYFQSNGSTEWEEIYEDSMTINGSGDVSISFSSEPGVALDTIKVLLRASTITNIVTGTVPALSESTITIDSPTTPFQTISVWLEDGGILERVIPHTIIHDEVTNTTDVTFINEGASESFEIYWEDGVLESQEICVDGDLTDPGEWDDADIVLWGLVDYHTNPTSFSDLGKALYVHHISTYSAQGLRFPIAAVQGSPMRLNNTSIQTLYPRLASRVSGDQTVAPYFSDLGEGGRVESSAGNFGKLDVVSITWVSGTSVDVVVSVPDMVATDSSIDRDRLTLTNCGYSSNEGVFEIESVTEGVDQLTFRITNLERIDNIDDETDTGAYAAIYTDSVEVTDSERFFPGDSIVGSGLEDSGWSVITQDGTTVYLDNVRKSEDIPGGLRVRAVREGVTILPLRDSDRNPDVEPLVPGDSVTVSGHTRRIRVGSVNPNPTETVSLSTENDVVTMTMADTSSLTVGRPILIHDPEGDFSGVHTITLIPTDTTAEFVLADAPASGTVSLVGHWIELDESLDSVTDDGSTLISRPEQWYPIPTVSDSQHVPWEAADASDQPLLRSTLSRDTTYITNGSDPVMKFDSSQIYRAGLPGMQLDLFLRKDTAASEAIVTGNPSVGVVSESENTVVVAAADIDILQVGERVEHSVDSRTYTIKAINDTTNTITLDSTVSGTGGSLQRISTYKYYVRLNVVDSNGGLTGSAVVGSEDMLIDIGERAAVFLRVHTPPLIGLHDSANFELEIYRTRAFTFGTAGTQTYYRITSIPVDTSSPYIDFKDTTPDDSLSSTDLDPISSAIEGQELGTQWDSPLPSKYITAISNRVALANCQGWPTIDYTVRKNQTLGQVTPALAAGLFFSVRRDNTQVAADMNFEMTDTITVTGATFTGSVLDTAVSANEYVYLYASTVSGSLAGCGWYQADGGGSVDVGEDMTGLTRNLVRATSVGDIPVFLNDTSAPDYNYPKQFLIDGKNSSIEAQMVRRLAAAINWWQSTLQDAWLTARAGGDYSWGQIVLKAPRYESTVFEGEWTSMPQQAGIDVFNVFGNGRLLGADEQVSAFSRSYPSRVLVSEENFPETFTAPEATYDVSSRGVIDVNPSDGQEITGISTFFGDSTTSSSVRQGTLVVFKENSIYAVDVVAGVAQKLETEGKGCTVPGSIVSTKGGIMFANISGIYVLSPDFQISYVGRRYERNWRDLGTSDYADAAGTFRNFDNKWMLTVGDETIVYDTARLYEGGLGSFARYDSHDAVGYTNIGDIHCYSSRRCTAIVVRNNGDVKDYLHEGNPIVSTLTWRPVHFGNASIRKVLGKILTHYRILHDEASVQVYTQADLDGPFEICDDARLEQALGGTAQRSLLTISTSPATPRGIFFSVRWISQDEYPIEITGLGWQVAGLNTSTIREAAST